MWKWWYQVKVALLWAAGPTLLIVHAGSLGCFMIINVIDYTCTCPAVQSETGPSESSANRLYLCHIPHYPCCPWALTLYLCAFCTFVFILCYYTQSYRVSLWMLVTKWSGATMWPVRISICKQPATWAPSPLRWEKEWMDLPFFPKVIGTSVHLKK